MKKSFFSLKNRSKTFNVKSYEDSDKKAKTKIKSNRKFGDKIAEKIKIFDKNPKNKSIIKNGQNIVVEKRTGNAKTLVKNKNRLDKLERSVSEKNNDTQVVKPDRAIDNAGLIIDKAELKKQIDDSINFINIDFVKKLGRKAEHVKFKTYKPNSNNLVKNFNKYVNEYYALRDKLNEIYKSGKDVLSIKRHLGYYNNLCKYINNKQEEEIDTTNQSKEDSTKKIQDLFYKFNYELLLPHEKADEKGHFSLKFVKDAKKKEEKIKKSMEHYINELEKLKFQVSKLKENINASKTYTSLDFNIESIVKNIGNRLGTVSQFITKIWRSSWPASHFKKQIDEAQDTLIGEKNSIEFLFNQIDDIKTSVARNSKKLNDLEDKSKLNMIDRDELVDLKQDIDKFIEFCHEYAKEKVAKVREEIQTLIKDSDRSTDEYGRKVFLKFEIEEMEKNAQKKFNDAPELDDQIKKLGINKNFKKILKNLYQIILNGELFRSLSESFEKSDTIFVEKSKTPYIIADILLLPLIVPPFTLIGLSLIGCITEGYFTV